jgi:hypothetical protein
MGAEQEDGNILRLDGNDSTETGLDINMTSEELQKEGSVYLLPKTKTNSKVIYFMKHKKNDKEKIKIKVFLVCPIWLPLFPFSLNML